MDDSEIQPKVDVLGDTEWVTIMVPRGSALDPSSDRFLVFGESDTVDAAPGSCTPKGTRQETYPWQPVRHLLADGRAKCFEAQCTVTWQDYKEAPCTPKIVKRECKERNVRIVPGNQPCP